MGFPESAALPVRRAQEKDIQAVQGHLRGKSEAGIAPESGMHGGHFLPAMALGVDKDQLGRRMMDQQPDQFSGGVTGTANDANPYHTYSPG